MQFLRYHSLLIHIHFVIDSCIFPYFLPSAYIFISLQTFSFMLLLVLFFRNISLHFLKTSPYFDLFLQILTSIYIFSNIFLRFLTLSCIFLYMLTYSTKIFLHFLTNPYIFSKNFAFLYKFLHLLTFS